VKVLVDTNVVLNKLLRQADFYAGSNTIFVLVETGYITGYVSASAITDIFYIAGKSLGKAGARDALRKMLSIFHPATVTGDDIYKALDLEWNDFEDSVQFVVGEVFRSIISLPAILKTSPAAPFPQLRPNNISRLLPIVTNSMSAFLIP